MVNALRRRIVAKPLQQMRMGRPARPGEVDYHAVDKFTIAHYAAGLLTGAARVPWWGALLMAVGWEIVERPLKRSMPGIFPSKGTQDTWPNMIGDVAAMMAGYTTWRIIPGRDGN